MIWLAAVLTGLAGAVVLLRPDDGRLHRVLPPAPSAPPARPAGSASAGLACLLAGAAVALLLPGVVGLVTGLATAVVGPRLLASLESAHERARREQLSRDLPLVLDLLAACLAGGASLPAAAAAVAEAVAGPAGSRLGAVASALAVGCAPAEAWASLADPESATPPGRGGTGGLRRFGAGAGRAGDEDPLASAARTLSRAAEGGAPVAAAVSRLAVEARADARARDEQAARRVGVLAVAPLGLCFLPAFVLLGVVPVVVGLAGPLLEAF